MAKQKRNIKLKIRPRQLLRWLGLSLLLAVVLWLSYSNLVEPQLAQQRQAAIIRGLAEEFPRLIAELETKIDETLYIETDCFSTQEKFSEGVNSCGMTVAKINLNDKQIESVGDYIISSPLSFTTGEESNNNSVEGNYLYFEGNKACSTVYSPDLYIDCRVGYSEANVVLINELLSEDRLNQQKNQYLQNLQQ